MFTYKPTAKSKKLFSLLDRLQEQSGVVIHDAIVKRKKNKLDIVENGAKEVEQIAIEMQELIKSMRKK